MTTEEIPDELVQRLSDGDCVVFIGAGLSIAAGMPGWNDLIRTLGVELNAPKKASLLEIPQVYEKVYGRQRLEERIRSYVDSTGKKTTDNHSLLCSLGNLEAIFVTTNYDDLIEMTLREQAQKYKAVVLDEDLAGTSKYLVTLIKLHGDRARVGTMVITLNDYLTLNYKNPFIMGALTHLLATKTFLFVGYSSRDMDFQHFQARVSSHLSPHSRKSYAVLDRVSEFEEFCLDRLDVVPIDIRNWGKGNKSLKLTVFLLELFQRIVLYRNRNKDILKRVCTSAQARKLVPTALIDEMKSSGRNLVGCIDFITYVDATDSGQYNWQPSLDLRPHTGNNEHNRNVKYYRREDKDKNIHEGLAFFL